MAQRSGPTTVGSRSGFRFRRPLVLSVSTALLATLMPLSASAAEAQPEPTAPAQHFTDFGDAVVGQSPADWSTQWRAGDWSVLDDPRRLRHVVDSSAGRRALTWDVPGDLADQPGVVVGDVEVYTKVRGRSRAPFQVPIHLSGTVGAETAIYIDLNGDSNSLRIQRYVAGTPSTLASVPFPVVEDRWYHVVFRGEAGQFKAKVWADGDAEPADWMIQGTDATFTHGRVGFSNFLTGSVGEYAAYGVGTGGLAAPRALPPGPPDHAQNERGRPAVNLIAPTSANRSVNWPGMPLTVSFTVTQPWPYAVELRRAGTAAWQVFDGAAARDRAATGRNSIRVTVPEEATSGEYDVRVRLFTPGGVERVADVAEAALEIVEPVKLLSPTGSAPVAVRAGHPVQVKVAAAAPGDFVIEFAMAGRNEWTPFAADAGRVSLKEGTSTITVTVPSNAPAGTADLRVRPGEDDAGVAADRVAGALVIQAAPRLLTPFERHDGGAWTSHAEELEFLDTVAAQSGRVASEEIGRTLQDRPMHLVRIGAPAPRSLEEIAAGRAVLFLCSQHGGEPSGREACLQLIRDLAFTDDPDVVAYLQHTTILVVPNANPDGREAYTRGNAAGIDTNRDHLVLETPEGRAMARVLRDTLPDIVVDLHDNGVGDAQVRPGEGEMQSGWTRGLNADPQIVALSENLVRDWVLAGAEERGYTTAIWGGGSGGDRDPSISRNTVGLRHSLGVLIESRNGLSPERPEEATGNLAAGRLRRTHGHLNAINDILDFHRANAATVQAVTDGSRERKARQGAEQSVPFHLSSSRVLDPPPCGYVLHDDLVRQVAPVLDLHGIEFERLDGGVLVRMSQPAMTVIPLLLDQRASTSIAAGQVVVDCGNIPTPLPPQPPLEPTVPAQHFTDFSGTQVGQRPGDWSVLWRDSDWTVLDEPRRLQHTVDSSAGRRALTWDAVGDLADQPGVVVGDVEVYTKVRGRSRAPFQVPIYLSGPAGAENGVYVDLNGDAQTVRIQRYLDGAPSTLASRSFPVIENRWYHVVFRAEGGRLMAKVWADGDAEPTSWMVQATETTLTHGRVGFANFLAGSVGEYAAYGVGTGGQAAPRTASRG